MGNKGGQFERDMARAFSLWWSKGKHDDLLWRTSQSGGRSTQRAKKGKRTFGQHSDLCSTHPNTRRLFELVVIELKKGYSKKSSTLSDCFDTKGLTEVNRWHLKAWRDARAAEVPFWLLVHRRSRRVPTLTMPNGLYQLLRDAGMPSLRPALVLHPPNGREGVIAVHLEKFQERCTREHFREALNIMSVVPQRYSVQPPSIQIIIKE